MTGCEHRSESGQQEVSTGNSGHDHRLIPGALLTVGRHSPRPPNCGARAGRSSSATIVPAPRQEVVARRSRRVDRRRRYLARRGVGRRLVNHRRADPDLHRHPRSAGPDGHRPGNSGPHQHSQPEFWSGGDRNCGLRPGRTKGHRRPGPGRHGLVIVAELGHPGPGEPRHRQRQARQRPVKRCQRGADLRRPGQRRR